MRCVCWASAVCYQCWAETMTAWMEDEFRLVLTLLLCGCLLSLKYRCDLRTATELQIAFTHFQCKWHMYEYMKSTEKIICLIVLSEHKATLCNLDRDPWLWKWNKTMHANMSHKTAVLVKPGHILWGKCPLVFALMSYDCFASTLWSSFV